MTTPSSNGGSTPTASALIRYDRRTSGGAEAKQVMNLQIPGVSVLREYRRYYPMGEVTGHLVGFTNIDDVGQEGLERAFDNWLKGEPGRKKVLKDNKGQVIEDVEQIEAPRPGQVLASSIDLRIQYLAYRELKAAVQKHQAVAGTVVVLDIHSGEVLAMVNQPSYNPNDRTQLDPKRYRNRAITDIFEPGSTMKPLVVAAGLESGKYGPNTVIDTSPGYIQVSNKLIEDKNNLGRIDLATIISRSSNVGATKLAMGLDRDLLWTVLDRFGLGHLTGSDFPGESAGLLSHHSNWRSISQATLSYGYGVSMTPLQIARAYATLGTGGLDRKVSLVRMDQEPIARKVVSQETAFAVLNMMEQVVAPGGTGTPAAVPGYRVAGKTGTALKFTVGGYAEDRYTAMFAGVIPATRPRLAAAVVIDEPRGREYYGGIVAGPVFSAVMEGAMRILSVPPDDFDSLRTDTAGTVAVNEP